MTFGLTAAGFNAKRLADIKVDLQNAFIGQFGDINTDPQSVTGQLIGIFSKAFADNWENLEDVYFSQYPNSAAGVALDNVVQLNGITRLPETQTVVLATCNGIEGTYIPMNAQARIDTTNEVFNANLGGTITRQNACEATVEVLSLGAQAYTVVLSNTTFTYSLPIITFSNVGDIFVTGNVIVVTVNGVQLAPISWATSSDVTLNTIKNAIGALPSVFSATSTLPNIITIIPAGGSSVTINSISITGGATQASYVITFNTPASISSLAGNLRAIINNGSLPLVASNDGAEISIVADSPALPFSCNVGTRLQTTDQSSPISFVALNYGAVPCPVGTLTTILTPIAGWTSITNTEEGAIGRLIETDAELRVRRADSIRLFGAATVESIRARIRQQVSGVTSALVFENRTLYQEDILIVFPLVFTLGDSITITANSVALTAIPWNTNQTLTMDDIVTALEGLPQVASASHGGTGDQTVTIEMNLFQELTINSAVVTGTAQTASIKGGRPPKSFEAVVEGGTDQAVAEKIWETKPAGIETFGNTSFPVVDSQGDTQIIFFSRPTPIYIWVQVALTLYTEETFPTDGVELVATDINAYGNSLGVGIDVLFQRVLAQIFNVSGIASGSMTLAATNLPTDSPSFGTADIIIQENEISIFDLERINVTVV